MKLGWFKQEGLTIEIVPLPGSTDCTKSVATRDVPIALPSVEPLAIVRPQGVKRVDEGRHGSAGTARTVGGFGGPILGPP